MFSHPYPHLPPEQPLTNSTSLLYQSPPFSIQTSPSTSPATKDMKDVSATKSSRASFYPKKRPSPHGVVKSHKSPLLPACGPVRRSPRFAKSTLNQQKQREAQILALRQQGILLEEEYRDEIRQYMHEMEVCPFQALACHTVFTHHATVVYYVFRSIHGSTT